MDNLIGLVNRIQKACTALGDYGGDNAVASLWDSLPSVAVVGGQVCVSVSHSFFLSFSHLTMYMSIAISFFHSSLVPSLGISFIHLPSITGVDDVAVSSSQHSWDEGYFKRISFELMGLVLPLDFPFVLSCEI